MTQYKRNKSGAVVLADSSSVVEYVQKKKQNEELFRISEHLHKLEQDIVILTEQVISLQRIVKNV
jgi:hypothetical protein